MADAGSPAAVGEQQGGLAAETPSLGGTQSVSAANATDMLLTAFRQLCGKHGGPCQYLQHSLPSSSAKQDFLAWLWKTIPPSDDSFFHFSGPLAGSNYQDALKQAPDRIHCGVLGFGEECPQVVLLIMLSCRVVCFSFPPCWS